VNANWLKTKIHTKCRHIVDEEYKNSIVFFLANKLETMENKKQSIRSKETTESGINLPIKGKVKIVKHFIEGVQWSSLSINLDNILLNDLDWLIDEINNYRKSLLKGQEESISSFKNL
jgi:hypothetical protein